MDVFLNIFSQTNLLTTALRLINILGYNLENINKYSVNRLDANLILLNLNLLSGQKTIHDKSILEYLY